VRWNSSAKSTVLKTRNFFMQYFLQLFFKCLHFSRYLWRFARCGRKQRACHISYWCFLLKLIEIDVQQAEVAKIKTAYIQTQLCKSMWIITNLSTFHDICKCFVRYGCRQNASYWLLSTETNWNVKQHQYRRGRFGLKSGLWCEIWVNKDVRLCSSWGIIGTAQVKLL